MYLTVSKAISYRTTIQATPVSSYCVALNFTAKNNIDNFEKSNKNPNPLFSEGIKNITIRQSNIGNCQMLSVLDALSRTPKGSELIENMVKLNPNGTVDVSLNCFKGKYMKFSIEQLEKEVIYDKLVSELPQNQIQNFINSIKFKNPSYRHLTYSRPLGIHALELAYAKYQKQTYPEKFKDSKKHSIYNSPNYHHSVAKIMKDFAGLNPRVISSGNVQENLNTLSAGKKQKIINILKNYQANPHKYIIVAGSIMDSKIKFVPWHDYSIRSFNSENETLELANPWDTSKTEKISLKDLFDNFGEITYAKIT